MIRLVVLNLIDAVKFVYYAHILERSGKDEIYLFSHKENDDNIGFDIADFFYPTNKFNQKLLFKLKNKILRKYYIKIEYIEHTDSDLTSYFIGKNLEKHKNLVLYEINKESYTVIFTKTDSSNTEIEGIFYYAKLSEIDNVKFKKINRIEQSLDPNSGLLSDLERTLHKYNVPVFAVSIGSFLHVYPVETIKEQIIQNKNALLKLSHQTNTVISYSEAYKYDKKTKRYYLLIDSLNLKLVFIKKDFFNQWTSSESFSDLGMSDNGLFYRYKISGDILKKDGYIIEHVLISTIPQN